MEVAIVGQRGLSRDGGDRHRGGHHKAEGMGTLWNRVGCCGTEDAISG